ncbi:hypothetical protein BJ166DRAFT_333126 [Pestalotiopsis sp. NC0098]|nr:hypothetical protein BJ166DRAFT_333126 [Pestalotiopsis sp. NC0098]
MMMMKSLQPVTSYVSHISFCLLVGFSSSLRSVLPCIGQFFFTDSFLVLRIQCCIRLLCLSRLYLSYFLLVVPCRKGKKDGRPMTGTPGCRPHTCMRDLMQEGCVAWRNPKTNKYCERVGPSSPLPEYTSMHECTCIGQSHLHHTIATVFMPVSGG